MDATSGRFRRAPSWHAPRRDARAAEHDSLADVAGAAMQALASVLVPFLAAYSSSVGLDFAGERSLEASGIKRRADAMQHEPCGLLANADRSRETVRAIAFLEAVSNQTAGSHLSSPSGESSNILPTLTENCILQDLQRHSPRVWMNQ